LLSDIPAYFVASLLLEKQKRPVNYSFTGLYALLSVPGAGTQPTNIGKQQ
jgi:hypothetical protein